MYIHITLHLQKNLFPNIFKKIEEASEYEKKRGEGDRNGANKRHYFKVAAPKDHHSSHVEEEKSSEMAQLISMKEAEFLDSWIYN